MCTVCTYKPELAREERAPDTETEHLYSRPGSATDQLHKLQVSYFAFLSLGFPISKREVNITSLVHQSRRRERGAYTVPSPDWPVARMAPLQAYQTRSLLELAPHGQTESEPQDSGQSVCSPDSFQTVLTPSAGYEAISYGPELAICSILFLLCLPPLVRTLHQNHPARPSRSPRPCLCGDSAWMYNAHERSNLFLFYFQPFRRE